MDKLSILKECRAEGLLIRLPEVKIERSVYLEVKQALELIGGKWKGGKTQAFVFEQDPADLLADLQNGDGRNLKQEFQFFATPKELADRMAAMTGGVGDGLKILEPSAGDGALIKALHRFAGQELPVDCFELMDLNRKKLATVPNITILGWDFLIPKFGGHYDIVIANPPFTKNQDIYHIGKMWEACKPGGVIVTLASMSWTFGSQKLHGQFRDWLNEIGAEQEELPEGTFKESGTNVKAMLLRITKPVTGSTPVQWIITNSSNKVKPESHDNQEAIPEVDDIPVLTNETLPPSRKCRECGCTDSDCRQCIKKTGNPCHWVEDDLCSACEIRSPDEIMKDLEYTTKQIDQQFSELKKLITNTNEMEFFKRLKAELGQPDLTLRIMGKDEELTINIMPGATSTIKPLVVTGTAEDLDVGFFEEIVPGLKKIAGLRHNIEQVEKAEEDELQKAGERKTKVVTAAAKKPSPKKPEPKKIEPPKEEEVGLFTAVEETPEADHNEQTE